MRFVARGRDCDVFDLGDGTVLRRRRRGDVDPHEAAVMRHVAGHGFPCPHVHRIDGPDLVLDRVEGPTMSAWLLSDPSDARIVEAARILADLHDRLHRVPAMASGARGAVGGVPPRGTASCIVHLDLHPENVLLGRDGPIVIDWTNATDGPPELDLAMTWVILEPLASSAPVRRFVDAFLDAADRTAAVAGLPGAARMRLSDHNTTREESAAVSALLEAHC